MAKQRFCAYCMAAVPGEMHKDECPAGSSCDLCGLRARVRLNLGTAGVDRRVLLCDWHASQSNPFLDYVEQTRHALAASAPAARPAEQRVIAAAREYVAAWRRLDDLTGRLVMGGPDAVADCVFEDASRESGEKHDALLDALDALDGDADARGESPPDLTRS